MKATKTCYIFETPHFEMGCLKIINVFLTFPEKREAKKGSKVGKQKREAK
jgi:hypothetical protein